MPNPPPIPTVSILSNPSKMPGFSFGLPAGKSCPWAVYEPDSTGVQAICAGCYAQAGNYRFNHVKRAQQARFDWVRRSLKTKAGQDRLVDVMVGLIAQTGQGWFRIHDSGDFFSPAYVRVWVRIAKRLTDVKFWAPTRSYQDARMLVELRKLAALENVTVRPSALHFGEPPPVIEGLQAGSGAGVVGDGVRDCPAPEQGGKCGECRVCWDKGAPAVSYKVHGKRADRLVQIGKQRALGFQGG